MRSLPAALVRRVLRRSGWQVREVGPGLYVEPQTTARQAGRRTVSRIGPPGLDTHVVSRPRGRRGHFQRNNWEVGLLRHAADEHAVWALHRLRIDVVLDVGANAGQYATRLRECGYRGRIVSFEPVSEFVEQLRRASADDPDWWVRPYALGQEETTAEINLAGKMSSLLGSSEFGREWAESLEFKQTETVQVRRLDAVLDDALEGLDSPRVFLKMDAQGYDVDVLRGAGDRLAEVLGLQSEVACLQIYDGMPRFPEQLALYEEAGFEISGIFPVSRHVRSMRVIEFDLLMVRAQAALEAVSGHGHQPELGG